MSCKLTCECCTSKRRLYCWRACGVVSFVLTLFFALALGFSLTDELFFLIVKTELQLVPHSSMLDDWVDSDVPLYKKMYIYDTENPIQFSLGAVPFVKEVGPFTYREYDKKLNLTWNSDESLVTYNRNKYYVFVPEKSIGDPRDYKIHVLNIPLLTVLNQLQNIENLLFGILGSAAAQAYITMIGDQTLFVEKTAHEIIWGYHDPLVTMLRLLRLTDSQLMMMQSNTSDSTLFFKVHTGKKDIDSVGNLVQFENLTMIAGWGSEDARRIYGSLGIRFQPRMKEHNTLIVFSDTIYRHVAVVYTGQSSLHGIDLYHYELAHYVYSNSSEYPPNAGYYAYDFKYGVLNLTAISNNFPFYYSNPHCLDCDSEYFKNVSGYHPDRSKHGSYAKVEPFTGISMEVSVCGQLNVGIERNMLSRQLSFVRDFTIYPWYYTIQEASITKHEANDFKLAVQLPRTILKISVILFLCISGIASLCSVGVLLRSYYNRWTKADNVSLLKSSDHATLPVNSINYSDSSLLLDDRSYQDYHTISQN